MILPPYERLAEVTGDEEPDFARGQAVVSHLAVVIQTGHDGLGRAAWVRRNKTADFAAQAFKSGFFLASF
jgi:hypothetical protein